MGIFSILELEHMAVHSVSNELYIFLNRGQIKNENKREKRAKNNCQ